MHIDNQIVAKHHTLNSTLIAVSILTLLLRIYGEQGLADVKEFQYDLQRAPCEERVGDSKHLEQIPSSIFGILIFKNAKLIVKQLLYSIIVYMVRKRV